MSVVIRVCSTLLVYFVCTEAFSLCRPSNNLAYREVITPVTSDLCVLCEDSSQFVDYLMSIAPSRAMLLLTEPLMRDGATVELLNLRNAIVEIVHQYEHEFSIILRQLQGFKHLSREDLMISALLHLIEALPDECPKKSPIIETVNYVILKKYLYGKQSTNLPGYGIDFLPDINSLLSVLNGYIKGLGGVYPNGILTDSNYNEKIILSVIELIPKPRTPQEQLLYQIIVKLFTDNISVFPSLIDITSFRTPQELLESLVKIIVEQSSSPVIRQIFTAYHGLYPFVEDPIMLPDVLTAVIEILPRPKTAQQYEIYEIIINYIRELYPYIVGTVTEQTNASEIFKSILRYVFEKETRQDIRSAFLIYITGQQPTVSTSTRWPGSLVPDLSSVSTSTRWPGSLVPDLSSVSTSTLWQGALVPELPAISTPTLWSGASVPEFSEIIVPQIPKPQPQEIIIQEKKVDVAIPKIPKIIIAPETKMPEVVVPKTPIIIPETARVPELPAVVIPDRPIIPKVVIPERPGTQIILDTDKTVSHNPVIQAIALIPRPTSESETEVYNTIIRLIQKNLPTIMNTVDINRYTSPEELLQFILKSISDQSVTNEFQEYFNRVIPSQEVISVQRGPSVPMTVPSMVSFPSMTVPSQTQYIYASITSALNLIPQPKTPQEVMIYQQIMNFIQEILPQLTKYIDVTKYRTPEDLLRAIIDVVIQIDSGNQIKDYLVLYNLYQNESYKRVLQFIGMLPRPVTPEEQYRYEILVKYLKSIDITNIVPENILMSTENPEQMFMTIVSYLINSNIDETTKEILIYFSLKNHPLGVDLLDLFSSVPGINVMDYNILLKYLLSPDILKIGPLDLRAIPGSPQMRLKHLLLQLMKAPNRDITLVVQNLLRKLLIVEYGVDFTTLIPLLPGPVRPDHSLFNMLKEFFSGFDIYSFVSPNELAYTSPEQLLETVLQLLVERAPNSGLREAAISYLPRIAFRRIGIDIDALLSLLPLPTTPNEQIKVNLVKQFLVGLDVLKILRGIDVSRFTDNDAILDFLLKKMVEYPLNKDLQDAIWYVINVREKLDNIDLITKKEIRKHFKLTDIFKDTLPVETFTGEIRSAFKTFFDYITDSSQPIMSGFVTWDQARTRGEFMKLLFAYFLENPVIPAEVKVAVTMLDPLIRMDGKGALPP